MRSNRIRWRMRESKNARSGAWTREGLERFFSESWNVSRAAALGRGTRSAAFLQVRALQGARVKPSDSLAVGAPKFTSSFAR